MRCADCGHSWVFHGGIGSYPACCWRNYPEHSSLSGEHCTCKGLQPPAEREDDALERVWAHVRDRIGAELP